jgi:hypothetical protein
MFKYQEIRRIKQCFFSATNEKPLTQLLIKIIHHNYSSMFRLGMFSPSQAIFIKYIKTHHIKLCFILN